MTPEMCDVGFKNASGQYRRGTATTNYKLKTYLTPTSVTTP